MSLDRAAVIRNAKQLAVSLGLDPKNVVLSAGSALVLMGLRKTTSDLDVDVPKEFFEKQKARKGAKQGIIGEYVEWDGITDLHPILSESTVGKVTVDYEGVRVYHPEYLLAVKEVMVAHPDRQQDKAAQDRKDIKALKELLERVEA
jgi:hypothetical protein